MAKEEILECKNLFPKKGFSSEAEQFASPHKENTKSKYQSLESGRVFGRQIDSEYDDGHQLIAEIGDEVKASILTEKLNPKLLKMPQREIPSN